MNKFQDYIQKCAEHNATLAEQMGLSPAEFIAACGVMNRNAIESLFMASFEEEDDGKEELN